MEIKDQKFLKRENRRLVLNLIIKNHPISRSEIAEKAAMSFTSASRIVTSLLEADLIDEERYKSDGAGRKASYLAPKEDAATSIGVELDEKQIRIGFMNFIGELIVINHLNYEVDEPNDTVQYIAEHVRTVMHNHAIIEHNLIGICIGLPGLVNLEEGKVHFSAQLGWRDVPLKDIVERELGIPTLVENELKLKAFAEYEYVDKETAKNIVLLGFGSGVGSVLMTDGAIYRGKDNFAGEIGHTIVEPNGNYCPCGNFGCLQTYIAEQFLVKEAFKVKPVKHVNDILIEMEKGEKWAKKIIQKAVTYAAMTINNVINIHNPNLVIISGYLVESHPRIREGIIAAYRDEIGGLQTNKAALEVSKTKSEGIVIGSALSIQQLFIRNILFNE